MVGPAGITMYGEPAVFRAEVDVSNSNLQFAWTVSAGTIIEGQGTTQISVATDRSIAGKSMTAKVEVGGLPSACEKIASDTALLLPL